MSETKAEIKEKFANQEFPVHLIGRNVEVTDTMKEYALSKLMVRLKRFQGRVNEAFITMDIQRITHSIDYIVDVNNVRIKVCGKSENMYTSIDQAINHLDAKLTRYARRLHMYHNKKGVSDIEMNVNVIDGATAPLHDVNDMIEEENLKRIEADLKPRSIVTHETRTLCTLTQEEAIMKMDLSNDLFLVYRSEEDKKLKVVYCRNDGNYGVIEVES